MHVGHRADRRQGYAVRDARLPADQAHDPHPGQAHGRVRARHAALGAPARRRRCGRLWSEPGCGGGRLLELPRGGVPLGAARPHRDRDARGRRDGLHRPAGARLGREPGAGGPVSAARLRHVLHDRYRRASAWTGHVRVLRQGRAAGPAALFVRHAGRQRAGRGRRREGAHQRQRKHRRVQLCELGAPHGVCATHRRCFLRRARRAVHLSRVQDAAARWPVRGRRAGRRGERHLPGGAGAGPGLRLLRARVPVRPGRHTRRYRRGVRRRVAGSPAAIPRLPDRGDVPPPHPREQRRRRAVRAAARGQAAGDGAPVSPQGRAVPTARRWGASRPGRRRVCAGGQARRPQGRCGDQLQPPHRAAPARALRHGRAL